jgi:acetyltransferase
MPKADRYKEVLEACLNDENVDGVLIIYTAQAVAEPVEIAKSIGEVCKNMGYQSKTILTSFMGSGAVEEANRIFLIKTAFLHIPLQNKLLKHIFTCTIQRNLELLYETPEELPVDAAPPKRPIMVIMRNAALENRDS